MSVQRSVRFRDDVFARLRERALRERRSFSWVVNEELEGALEPLGPEAARALREGWESPVLERQLVEAAVTFDESYAEGVREVPACVECSADLRGVEGRWVCPDCGWSR